MKNHSLYKEKINEALIWQPLVYFTTVYRSDCFESAVEGILKKEGFILDYAACIFPDLNSNDPDDHFDGVLFEAGSLTDDSEVIISNEKCLELLKDAVGCYLKKHPERKYVINNILEKYEW